MEGIIYNETRDNYTVYHNGRRVCTAETYERAEFWYDYICEKF